MNKTSYPNFGSLIVVVVALIGLGGCAVNQFVISASSNVDAQTASATAVERLKRAEDKGCKAISIAAGTGIGVAIPGECKTCDSMSDRQKAHDFHILVRCPSNVTEIE